MPCGEAGSYVAYQLRWNSNVKLSFMPLRGRGANIAATLMFQLSGLPPNWPTHDCSCFQMQNAMPIRVPLPLRPLCSSCLCSIRTTCLPISAPRLIGVKDRAGRVVAKECYLVDPTSSHMLVSKIKSCMCKYELIQTMKLRMAH